MFAQTGSRLRRCAATVQRLARDRRRIHRHIARRAKATSTSIATLLTDVLDLGPRLGGYRFTQATDTEIDRLITEGELALDVLFDDRPILLNESAGNFWLAQYVCNKICAMEEVFRGGEDVRVLTFDLLTSRQRLMAELTQRYLPVARAFAKGKRWRPGGRKPYLEVLLALSRIQDSVVSFDKILTRPRQVPAWDQGDSAPYCGSHTRRGQED